jgi:hypothetical protein
MFEHASVDYCQARGRFEGTGKDRSSPDPSQKQSAHLLRYEVDHTPEPPHINRPQSATTGTREQIQQGTSASSVILPYHERGGSIQDSYVATPGQLTVLTLPRLDINQSSQVQEVARNMMDEANSLLADYSNIRLAFSAQDMGTR